MLPLNAYTQGSSTLDSLTQVLSDTKDDSEKIQLLNLIGDELFDGNIKEAELNYRKALDVAISAKDENGKINSLTNIAFVQYFTDQLDSAIVTFNTIIDLAIKFKNIDQEGQARANLSEVYSLIGDNEKSLEQLILALEIRLNIDDTAGILNGYNNIAGFYYEKNQDEKALEYYLLAAELELTPTQRKEEASVLAKVQGNLGWVYFYKEDYAKAIEQFNKTLELKLEIGKESELVKTYADFAFVYLEIGQLKKARINIKKAIEIGSKLEVNAWFENTHSVLGDIEMAAGNYDLAINNFKISYVGYQKAGNLEKQRVLSDNLSIAYDSSGDKANAYKYLRIELELKKQLEENSSALALAEMSTRFDTERKEAENELLKKDGEIKDLAIEASDATNRSKNVVIGGVALSLILVIGLVFLLYNRNKLKQRTNEELSEQRDQIAEQKLKITDSIEYAQYIQAAVLPKKDEIADGFADSFTLFLPRDVVSGDFYWHTKIAGRKVIAVADCTGHGVPGAFMSMMGAELLNQVIADHDVTSPGLALTEIDKRIKKNLNASDQESGRSDGMDLALCVFYGNKVHFSGANRPLVLIRDGEFMSFKPNKYGVGGASYIEKDFKSESIDLRPGDTLYMYSDGYPDQFGGPKGKKFMGKKLNNLLLEISSLPMKAQESRLLNEFNEWKKDIEQVDDVCLMGIRI